MEEKIRFYQSKICRICLNSGEMVNIFKRNLQQVYEDVTNLPISKHDQMPKVICSNCLPRITDAYLLKTQAKRSYGNFCETNENEDDVSTTTTIRGSISKDGKEESITTVKNENQYETVNIQFVEDSDSVDSDKAATDEYEDLDNKLQEIVENEEPHDDDIVDEDDDEQLLVISTKEDEDDDLLIISTKEEERLGNSKSEQRISDQSCGDDDEDIDAVSFLIERQLEEQNFNSNQDATTADRKKSKSQDRKHECQVCHKKFLRKSNLVDHLRLHANVKLFKCEFCDKAFVQSGNYRSHIRIHTNERPYVCHICPKSYNQSSALKIHIRSHTNERNYKCDICSKAFTNSSDLGKHKRVHDPEKKIKCEFCNKSFAQKANLKLHIKNNHQDKLMKVES